MSIEIPVVTCSRSGSARPIGMPQAIGWLGHELHHALEMARDPSVRDQASVKRLFQRIGYWHPEFNGYETAAALLAQRTVAHELSKPAGR